MHGFAIERFSDHCSDWYGGSDYNLGILNKAQRPFKESILNSGPGQMSYEILDKEVTQQTLHFLNNVGKSSSKDKHKPFALQVGFMLPHQPYVANQNF